MLDDHCSGDSDNNYSDDKSDTECDVTFCLTYILLLNGVNKQFLEFCLYIFILK